MVLDEEMMMEKMISEYIWKIYITIIAFQVGDSVTDKIELVVYCVAVFVIRYLNLTSFAKFVLAVEW